jgi:gamma-glutamyltranspeptidase / glutathione hydrolase
VFRCLRLSVGVSVVALHVLVLTVPRDVTAEEIRGSGTYRAEVRGQLGVVAAGRHFAAEAGMRMLARGGNAVDAGVASTFAAAVTEISHFGLGGEVPIILYLADRKQVVVINGQGSAPAAASVDVFRERGIPSNGPSAGTIPAVVDALTIALAEFGTLSLADVMAPALSLADGFPWYDFLTYYLRPELQNIQRYPTGARVYLQGPEGRIPAVGSLFRQPDLARTLRALVDEEQRDLSRGRKEAIYAARDRFYRGDIGPRIAGAVKDAGGLLTADDLARYRGRVEQPTRFEFTAHGHRYEVFKTGFWGQGPLLLQTLSILQGFDLADLGHNSAEYIHTLTEALKLALADRDAYYGDPDFAKVPAEGLLSPAYAAERRKLIDPKAASDLVRPGDPWRFGPRAERRETAERAAPTPVISPAAPLAGRRPVGSPDTTCVNIADSKGNLFSASPSGAWFFGGVFIAGDTGVPLGNRMQAFVLDTGHPNVVQGGKRPRTTLSPTIVLQDGKPFLALSSPGGDSQDQQALQVLLNIIVFEMRVQTALEVPRFNSLHYHESFGAHPLQAGVLEIENRLPADVIAELKLRGHKVVPVGGFMMDTGTTLAGFDAAHGTVFGAADVRRQRFVTGW